MADVFISYARADRDNIEKLAEALEATGYSVWWDRDIKGGAQFAAEIGQQLADAKSVIVAWSEHSLGSEWVLDEAGQAREDGKLIPVILDDVLPPLGFRQRQAIDLSSWAGTADAPEPEVAKLKQAIDQVLSGEANAAAAPIHRVGAAPSKTISPRLLFSVAIALSVILIISLFQFRTPSTNPSDASVVDQAARFKTAGIGLAVLPFVNMSSDSEEEYFTDGLTEELLNWLANVEGLNVPGRATSFQFKGKTDNLRAVAQNLGVSYLLSGSVRRGGDQLRITAQLIDAETGFHLWSETYDRKLQDIFAVQDEVAQHVVTELLGAVPKSGMKNPAAVGNVDPRAHELYLEGRALIARRLWRAAFAKFYPATQIDPDHALAHAYVAFIAAQLGRYGYAPDITTDDFNKIRDRSLAKAIELKPDAADVLFAQGWVLEQGEENIDPESALARRILNFYERAVRANPRHVDAIHASAHLTQSQADRISKLERILEIDRGHAAASSNLAMQYYKAGDADSARRLIEETLRIFPNTRLTHTVSQLRVMGYANEAFEYYLRDCCDSSQPVRRRRAAALADLGAVEEAAYLLRKFASQEAGHALKYWTFSLAAALEGDRQARADLMQRANDIENAPNWAKGGLARALILAGEPARGRQIIQENRPNLKEGAQLKIQIGYNGGVTDYEAFSVAKAYELTGRTAESEKIWRAALEALSDLNRPGWEGDIVAAIVHANLGDNEKALAALDSAYEAGFRFLFSFDFEGFVERDFYEPDGFFAPIYDTPEFQAYRAKIEQENAAILARLNEKYDFLDRIRAEMAAEAEKG